ncbi:hypothetical protein JKP88DRAFT_273086 [Tribonema minus]|uniref:Uncharacterized protein n=1 Tax=Tribonema minus TaxID=303371 RepID=A0A835YX46_9STRA|nr:hypothetical protein JKP88DRAFT_273086 [Tribonema minus]
MPSLNSLRAAFDDEASGDEDMPDERDDAEYATLWWHACDSHRQRTIAAANSLPSADADAENEVVGGLFENAEQQFDGTEFETLDMAAMSNVHLPPQPMRLSVVEPAITAAAVTAALPLATAGAAAASRVKSKRGKMLLLFAGLASAIAHLGGARSGGQHSAPVRMLAQETEPAGAALWHPLDAASQEVLRTSAGFHVPLMVPSEIRLVSPETGMTVVVRDADALPLEDPSAWSATDTPGVVVNTRGLQVYEQLMSRTSVFASLDDVLDIASWPLREFEAITDALGNVIVTSADAALAPPAPH